MSAISILKVDSREVYLFSLCNEPFDFNKKYEVIVRTSNNAFLKDRTAFFEKKSYKKVTIHLHIILQNIIIGSKRSQITLNEKLNKRFREKWVDYLLEKKTAIATPEELFGDYSKDNVVEFPKEVIPEEFEVNNYNMFTHNGFIYCFYMTEKKKHYILDFNHPLVQLQKYSSIPIYCKVDFALAKHWS